MMRMRLRRDDGTVMLYALGGLLLVLAVVLVLSDTSSLFMRRAALMMVADDAALAAANAIDVDALYQQGIGGVLPLDLELARSLAQQSVDGVQDARLHDVRLDAVTLDGDGAQVEVSAAVPSQLSGIVGLRNVRIRVRASATTPTRF